MKRKLAILVTCLAAMIFVFGNAWAGKRGKFGKDSRAKIAKRVTFKTSHEKIRWKQVISLALICLFPALVTWLPSVFFGA